MSPQQPPFFRPRRPPTAPCALALVLALVRATTACDAPGPAPSTLSFPTPRALTACDAPPTGLQARLWVSGHSAPCFLEVVEGAARGDCEVTPGITRRFTLDWFVDDGGRTTILAQASREIDLSRAAEDTVSLSFSESDIKTSPCLDMSSDSFSGADTVIFDGVPQPVCDLDGDGIANLEELCAGDVL
jgi:hypothetical protein